MGSGVRVPPSPPLSPETNRKPIRRLSSEGGLIAPLFLTFVPIRAHRYPLVAGFIFFWAAMRGGYPEGVMPQKAIAFEGGYRAEHPRFPDGRSALVGQQGSPWCRRPAELGGGCERMNTAR